MSLMLNYLSNVFTNMNISPHEEGNSKSLDWNEYLDKNISANLRLSIKAHMRQLMKN